MFSLVEVAKAGVDWTTQAGLIEGYSSEYVLAVSSLSSLETWAEVMLYSYSVFKDC